MPAELVPDVGDGAVQCSGCGVCGTSVLPGVLGAGVDGAGGSARMAHVGPSLGAYVIGPDVFLVWWNGIQIDQTHNSAPLTYIPSRFLIHHMQHLC